MARNLFKFSYIVHNNNIVKNIILGNSDFAESYDGVAIILKDENVSIGYIYKNKKFTAPVKTSEQIEGEARTCLPETFLSFVQNPMFFLTNS